VCKAEIRYTQLGEKTENVLYFDLGATPTSAAMLTLAAGLKAWWVAELRPYISDDTQLREIYMTDMSSATGPTATYATGLPLAGSVTGGSLPNNVTYCVSVRTANRGRSYRGRFYVAGIPKAGSANNDALGTYSLAYVDAVAQLQNSTYVGSAVHVVASFRTNNAPRTTGIATPVTSAVGIDSTLDSQRRRLPGRGQ
jgi:hypothetical protein